VRALDKRRNKKSTGITLKWVRSPEAMEAFTLFPFAKLNRESHEKQSSPMAAEHHVRADGSSESHFDHFR